MHAYQQQMVHLETRPACFRSFTDLHRRYVIYTQLNCACVSFTHAHSVSNLCVFAARDAIGYLQSIRPVLSHARRR